MNLLRFNPNSQWYAHNEGPPLLGSDINELMDAIDELNTQLDSLKDSIHHRIDYVQEQLSDHIRGGD